MAVPYLKAGPLHLLSQEKAFFVFSVGPPLLLAALILHRVNRRDRAGPLLKFLPTVVPGLRTPTIGETGVIEFASCRRSDGVPGVPWHGN